MIQESPDVHLLAFIGWTHFCTLTTPWEHCLGKREGIGRGLLLGWQAEIARYNRMKPAAMLWCARPEFGEATGHFHYHILVVSLNSGQTVGSLKAWEALWKRVSGYPIADCRLFDSSLPGVDYCMSQPSERDLYELNKYRGGNPSLSFRGDTTPMYSTALRKMLAAGRGSSILRRHNMQSMSFQQKPTAT